MLILSEVLMQEHELASFEGLIEKIKERALQGEIHFSMDVRPPFQDTPMDWEERLEMAFSTAR
jgi:hypothetical protein